MFNGDERHDDSPEKNDEKAECRRKKLAKFLFSHGVCAKKIAQRCRSKFIGEYESFNRWQEIDIESYKLPLKRNTNVGNPNDVIKGAMELNDIFNVSTNKKRPRLS